MGVKRISPSKDLGWRGILRNLNRFEVSGFLKCDKMYPTLKSPRFLQSVGEVLISPRCFMTPKFLSELQCLSSSFLPLDLD